MTPDKVFPLALYRTEYAPSGIADFQVGDANFVEEGSETDLRVQDPRNFAPNFVRKMYLAARTFRAKSLEFTQAHESFDTMTVVSNSASITSKNLVWYISALCSNDQASLKLLSFDGGRSAFLTHFSYGTRRQNIIQKLAGQVVFSDEYETPRVHEFVPSNKLAKFVARGIAKLETQIDLYHSNLPPSPTRKATPSLRSEDQQRPRGSDSHQLLDEAKKNITWNIKLALSAIATNLRRDSHIEQIAKLTQDGRFDDQVTAAIFESIPVSIYDAKDFLEQLHEELSPVAASGQYAGEYWTLILSSGELALKIDRRPEIEKKSWPRAKVLKRRTT